MELEKQAIERSINGYKISKLIGKGASAQVYLAVDNQNKQLAIKVIPKKLIK